MKVIAVCIATLGTACGALVAANTFPAATPVLGGIAAACSYASIHLPKVVGS